MRPHHKITILLLVIMLSTLAILNNTNCMLFMADSFSSTSDTHRIFRHRVFKILEKDTPKKDFDHFLSVKNDGDFSINLKVQIVSVVGVQGLADNLTRLYIDYQKDKRRASTISTVISSLGLMGAKDAIPILERLLDNYDGHNPLVSKYEIARSLYLITGQQYQYINSSGKTTSIKITAELEKAREAIKESEGRQRKYNEMLIIDEILMPPSHWTG